MTYIDEAEQLQNAMALDAELKKALIKLQMGFDLLVTSTRPEMFLSMREG